jgi:L-alanine-DL-glutamate epimerase-like enolase superfamily enzyme
MTTETRDHVAGQPAPAIPGQIRITRVESFILHVPIHKYVEDSFNTADQWGLPGVILHTDAGITGLGYTSTLTHGDTAIKSVIDDLYAPLLIGEDPRLHERIWQKLFWSKAHWVGRVGITTMAHAAVDIALWDIKAKAANLPLWRYLGGDKDGRVLSYNTDGGWLNYTQDELLAHLQSIVDQGWKAVKMKVGKANPREDYVRVKAARKALGDDVDLMIDANQIWDLTTARTWAPRMEEFQVRWLEEPMHPDDVRSHAQLARSTRIPLAVGEHVYSAITFRDFLEAGALGYVQADCTRLAGVTEWLQVAALARSFNVPVVPHHADMMRVHQHLSTALHASPMLEVIPWLQDIFEEPLRIEDGWVYPPETPGASTTVRADKFAEYRIA